MSVIGLIGLLLFVLAYTLIALEEKIHLPKSYPALFAGTAIFVAVGIEHAISGTIPDRFHASIEHLILEIANIFFFLYVAMTFIEVLVERNVFGALRHRLISRGYSYRRLFWLTGLLAFFISTVADNLTAALVLATILVTIERHNHAFLNAGAINIVVAANAGGAWSPFGDITTLMVWSAGKGDFFDFFYLFPAAFLGWLITALLLVRVVPVGIPQAAQADQEGGVMKPGGKMVVILGFLTIALSVILHHFFHIPAIWGMMLGLSLLGFFAHQHKRRNNDDIRIFEGMSRIENDTLLFFFGIMAAVGGLGYLGHLAFISEAYYTLDPTFVNILVGLVSAVIDNVPVMYAVLKANPALDHAQWMLVTLTVGIGGSIISFGSAAGVGVMGKLSGIYTFSSHMRHAWAVLAGFVVSLAVWYLQFELMNFY